MNTGKQLRMRRFTRRGGAVVVPLDHALFSEPAPAIRDLPKLVETIAKTEADGILITPGMLEHCAPYCGDLSIILRMDGTHTRLGQHLEEINLVTTLESAAALGVDMVVANIFVGTDNENDHLIKLGALATDCRRFGMPLMAEMMPISLLYYHYGRADKTAALDDINKELALVSRLGAEIGADCIKTQYSGDKKGFAEAVAGTPIPIWIAGGPKGKTDADFLAMIAEAMVAGARGVVIGRNVWGRDNPATMIQALCDIVHR